MSTKRFIVRRILTVTRSAVIDVEVNPEESLDEDEERAVHAATGMIDEDFTQTETTTEHEAEEEILF